MMMNLHFLFKRVFTVLTFFISFYTVSSQTITVNDSGFSSQELVNLLLANSCATTSNISISSTQAVANFDMVTDLRSLLQKELSYEEELQQIPQVIYTG